MSNNTDKLLARCRFKLGVDWVPSYSQPVGEGRLWRIFCTCIGCLLLPLAAGTTLASVDEGMEAVLRKENSNSPTHLFEEPLNPHDLFDAESGQDEFVYSNPGASSADGNGLYLRDQARCETIKYKIRRGDTLSEIFRRNGIPVREALVVARLEKASVLQSLVPGRVLELCKSKSSHLLVLHYELDNFEVLSVEANDDGWRPGIEQIDITVHHRFASGTINQSLFTAFKRAGINEKLVTQLVSIFGWDIDFALDIRRGDRYSIVYEELHADERKIGTGDIVAAEFVNHGMIYRAVRHIDENGNIEYYSPDGTSLRGTFLRTPVKFSRITSRFNGKRFHPKLKKWRAHRGVDYSAPRGTPVLVTADGRVSFVGRNGGYGKAVVVRHGGTYSTLYGHLSRFKRGLRKGTTVKQGDVIGYVGSTGLTTGPHLHYEFRVNGIHRDPLAFNIPRSGRIPARYRHSFLNYAQEWMDRLASFTETALAQK